MSCNHVSLSQKRKKIYVLCLQRDSVLLRYLFVEELESDLLPSDKDEVPFARHGPVVEPDLEDLVVQRDFWSSYAIGFLLDYRMFSISHLQHLINFAWRIRGAISIVGRESYFYIFHFEFLKDLIHICTEGP